ncbi:MAG: hypothetical protein J6S67_23470 [Methanobrevibacter sp.]|nr:hypothetical protein [Methanobrevibacter sp.]
MINFPLLTSEDIEVKVKQITKTGALMLLYKTARVDAKILDETVGVMNWCCDYEEIKGNLFCTIGIRENVDQDFVYKKDCGIESGQDDGNEKKAEASDAFKRAGTRLGIGRELYTSPQIWADVATVEKNGKWYLQDPYAKYVVTHIAYNEKTRVITELEICNAKSNIKVFSWQLSSEGAMGRKMVKTWAAEGEDEGATENVEHEAPEIVSKAPSKPVESVSDTKVDNSTPEEKLPLNALISAIGRMVKTMFSREGNKALYSDIVKRVTGDASFKCNAATEEQYDLVAGIYNALIEAGYGN